MELQLWDLMAGENRRWLMHYQNILAIMKWMLRITISQSKKAPANTHWIMKRPVIMLNGTKPVDNNIQRVLEELDNNKIIDEKTW